MCWELRKNGSRHDKEESGLVGVTFLENVALCVLADTFVLSGWVRKELGNVKLVKEVDL